MTRPTIATILMIFCISLKLPAQSVPKVDIIINSPLLMNQLNEDPQRFVGKTIKIDGAWIRTEDVKRDSREKSYFLEFRYGDPKSADYGRSESYGSFLGLYITNRELGGWIVKDEDYQLIKSSLSKLDQFHGKGTFYKADLYFLMKFRDPISGYKSKDEKPVVGELVWIKTR